MWSGSDEPFDPLSGVNMLQLVSLYLGLRVVKWSFLINLKVFAIEVELFTPT